MLTANSSSQWVGRIRAHTAISYWNVEERWVSLTNQSCFEWTCLIATGRVVN